MTDSVSEETEAMMKCLADWADKMVGFFPASPVREGYGYNHYKIPGSRTLLTPPVAMRQAYERCAREILRAAVNISNAKPEKAKLAKVTGIVGYPDMFSSEVCVFFDESYWLSFADRDSDEERWKPLPPESSLAARLGFIVPPGFHEQGYSTYARDDSFEPPFEEVGEVWIYNDVGQ